ncbi:5-guanidino-2-oxopentanoate decarboxylase [Pseudomonas syringae pv. syringae]|uniref:5-guanidino-2-oxopentanoate decarboxylase n=1 Tax=Pseudomonas syringae TaxID=317 RepID=UPI00165940CB|nr:5-guanidino-2-oxopentanoate decarboxylase [Pseudomonas syringae]MBC9742547.1 5-guanidino-2-oxopentanoate decarboxylase [Pseudomonas syringae pv. syringae]MBC9748527.1 5-guanidino-2-oxopentanoate decarboxylase [Pseudomonas syringae pv. syringae]MCH5654054.1 5-guanidino-2-oxopentanoate decarboxylase [Pseudomonas syringae]MDU8619839.1 5-guanidino-2-oxopentanoate decarboxylase [Pseudomonas syringae]
MTTCGEFLVRQLSAWGVDTVFGIPGVHTVELYRGLPGSGIRHITPRHEQGAGFMADGYARVSGKPGVCFIITGPGMTNILTAMGQAYADSIPMLVISSVNERHRLGLGNGYLHELPNQRAMVAGVSAFSHTLMSVEELPAVLGRAFAVFDSQRPRPVHIELPLDIIVASAAHMTLQPRQIIARPAPDPTAIARAAARLRSARRPLLLLGGGCVAAMEQVRELAARLDAPTALTINAKGLLPAGHPLLLGSNQSLMPVRQLALDADVVLAIGTELGETDYDVVFDGNFRIGGELIRIDIDTGQLTRNHPPSLAILSDATAAISALLAELPVRAANKASPGAQRTAAAQEQLAEGFSAWAHYRKLFECVLEVLPEARFVGDSTQTVYSGNHLVELDSPRRWFNASTGYGTLGYGLPAAIGARLAEPSRAVISLMGDGGIQFTLPELASAVEARVGIIVLLWNNQGYGEIKRYMERRDITPLGVDIHTPDFLTIARGFGCVAERARDYQHLQALLREAPDDRPLIIEIEEAPPFAP